MIYGANNFAKCSFEVFMNASCNFLATFKPLRSRVLSIVRVLFSVVVVCCKTKEEIDLCITGRCYPLKHIIMRLGTFLLYYVQYLMIISECWLFLKGLGLWCLMPLSTIFQLYCGDQFYWRRKPGVPDENNWPAASHWPTLSHNIDSSTPRQGGIRTHNVSGDRHWLDRYLYIQLSYDHDHDDLFFL